MATYTAPIREINFVLTDVLNVGRLSAEIPAFADATPDVLLGAAEEAAKLIEGQIAPLNHTGDQVGCKVKDGVVTVPPGFAEAYKLYSQAGWMSTPEMRIWATAR